MEKIKDSVRRFDLVVDLRGIKIRYSLFAIIHTLLFGQGLPEAADL